MACPKCGGTDRAPIAPGYYECSSRITIMVEGPAPGGVIGMVPEWATCLHRYQEGGASLSSSETCSCGTIRIGYCQRCTKPVCGDHSDLWGANRLCGSCLGEAVSARQVEIQAEQATKRAEVAQGQQADLLRLVSEVVPAAVESLRSRRVKPIRFFAGDATRSAFQGRPEGQGWVYRLEGGDREFGRLDKWFGFRRDGTLIIGDSAKHEYSSTAIRRLGGVRDHGVNPDAAAREIRSIERFLQDPTRPRS